jgi:hypothetical protein
MENVEINELCNFCICKKNNCKKIERHKEGNCMVYKCLNYCLDTTKIKPYPKETTMKKYN